MVKPTSSEENGVIFHGSGRKTEQMKSKRNQLSGGFRGEKRNPEVELRSDER